MNANSHSYPGYNPSFQYQKPPPTVIGWSIPEDSDTGFVSDYSNPDMICHKGATPGGTHAEVAAGGTVQVQWTKWPHPGPVIDYLAKCPGDCETVDKSTLQFFKIGEDGMLDNGITYDHKWAADVLASNNNSWNIVIPKDISSGNYVLRHEIIALHQAQNPGGAQNYPQCLNLMVTGGGSDNPPGVAGTALYKANDPGIQVNIYTSSLTYTIPGPSLYSGAIRATQAGLSSANGPGSTPANTQSSSLTMVTQAGSSSYAPAEIAIVTPPATASSYSSATLSIVYSIPSPSSTGNTPTTVSSNAAASAVSSISNTITSAASVVGSDLASMSTASVQVITYTIPIAPSSGSNYSGLAPDVPLPPGMTLRDLLGWVEFAVQRALDGTKYGQSSKRVVGRKHSRDLGPVH
jgi:cellulase